MLLNLSIFATVVKGSCAIFTIIPVAVQQEGSEFLWSILNKPIVKENPINIIRIYDTVLKEVTSQAISGSSQFSFRLLKFATSKLLLSQIFSRKASRNSLEECDCVWGKVLNSKSSYELSHIYLVFVLCCAFFNVFITQNYLALKVCICTFIHVSINVPEKWKFSYPLLHFQPFFLKPHS